MAHVFTFSEFANRLDSIALVKYLGAAGLALLLYDHALTFQDEVELIWTAPPSYTKWAFLLNRYAVPSLHLATGLYMGMNVVFSNEVCRYLLTATTILGIFSLAIANILVLVRVIRNWDRDRRIIILLSAAFIISFSGQCIAVVITLFQLSPFTVYSPLIRTCIIGASTPTLVAVWAFPLLLESTVLIVSLWNAIDRPRDARISLGTTLFSDGVAFFVLLILLRLINLILATAQGGFNAYVGILIIWASSTVILNRAMIFFCEQDTRQEQVIPTTQSSPRKLPIFERYMSARPVNLDLAMLRGDEAISLEYSRRAGESGSPRSRPTTTSTFGSA